MLARRGFDAARRVLCRCADRPGDHAGGLAGAGLPAGSPFALAHTLAQTGPLRHPTQHPTVANLLFCGAGLPARRRGADGAAVRPAGRVPPDRRQAFGDRHAVPDLRP